MTIGNDHQYADFQEMGRAFTDKRLLTEETLKELGFEDEKYNCYLIEVNGIELFAKHYGGIYEVWLDDYIANHNPRWKTVGSVKMLIEALKGDE